MATKNVNAESLTAVSLAVAVMLKPMQAQAKAEKAFDKVKSATWRYVQEAAACFDGTMAEADRTKLSGELARHYVKFYAGDSAKVAASQHAKAIFMIATGVTASVGGEQLTADRFASMGAYFDACKGKTPRKHADAGNAPKNSGASDAKGDARTDPTAPGAMSTAGLSVELGSAFVRLIEAARKSAEVADAVMFAANAPDRLVEFVAATLAARSDETAAKLAGKFGADKVKAKVAA